MQKLILILLFFFEYQSFAETGVFWGHVSGSRVNKDSEILLQISVDGSLSPDTLYTPGIKNRYPIFLPSGAISSVTRIGFQIFDSVFKFSLIHRAVGPKSVEEAIVEAYVSPEQLQKIRRKKPYEVLWFEFERWKTRIEIVNFGTMEVGSFSRANHKSQILIREDDKPLEFHSHRRVKVIGVTEKDNECLPVVWDPLFKDTFMGLGISAGAQLGLYLVSVAKGAQCQWFMEIAKDPSCWVDLFYQGGFRTYMTHRSKSSEFPLPIYGYQVVGCTEEQE